MIALKMLVTEICNRSSLNRGDDVIATLTCSKPECTVQVTGRHGVDMDDFELGREYLIEIRPNEAEFRVVKGAVDPPQPTNRRKTDPKE